MKTNKIKRVLSPIWKNPKMYGKNLFVKFLWGLSPIVGVLMAQNITKAIELGDKTLFLNVLVIYSLLFLGIELLSFFLRNRGWPTMTTISYINVYEDEIKKLLYSDNTAVEKIGTGKIIAIVKEGISFWVDTINGILHYIPKAIVSLSFMVIVLVSKKWRFLLVFVVLLGILSVLLIYLNKKVVKQRNISRDIGNEFLRKFVRIVMSKFEILQNNKVNYEIEGLNKNTYERFESEKKRSFNVGVMFKGTGVILFFIKVIVFFVIGFGVFSGKYSYSDIVLFTGAFGMISSFIVQFTKFFFDVTKNYSYIEKLRDTIDSLPKIKVHKKGKEFIYKKGEIELKKIFFKYEDGTNILQDFSLKIKGGQKTAFVGPSGAGKTTILKIIAGYIKEDSGSVFIDGQSLSEININSYYKHIGYLTQEPSIFDGTIKENLMYGMKNIDDKTFDEDKIKNIIKLSKCEFIYGFKKGLDTEIGERGIRLSGGQKQRLAIAKLMLKNPNIILLDEPTSALDSVSEQKISEAFHNLFKGKTVIIVAHRLQTVKESDEIIVIEKGKILERGTHFELEKKNGMYKQMIDLQTTF